MLDQLTFESFEPLVGSTFRLHHGDETIDLRLERARKVMESEAASLKRIPFSLYFVGPKLVDQKIYSVEHDAFDQPLEIFIVPIGKTTDGYRFEAVFT